MSHWEAGAVECFYKCSADKSYKFSRPIPERRAKGLVRETPENLKIEHRTDLDRNPGQIRLAAVLQK